MQSEAPGVTRVLLWQRDLREHLLSPLPRGAHALERGPIAESELGETVVEELDVDGLAAGGGPRLGGEAVDGRVGVRGRGRGRQAPGRRTPCRAGAPCRAPHGRPPTAAPTATAGS